MICAWNKENEKMKTNENEITKKWCGGGELCPGLCYTVHTSKNRRGFLFLRYFDEN